MGPKTSILPSLAVLFTLGCVYPTERSGQLTVVMDSLPVLRQGELDTLSAQVVNASGVVVPDAEILFQSSNSSALSINADTVQATGPGISVVTARALGFENATVAEQIVTVKSPVAIDSVRPRFVSFGSGVRIYGVGLNVDSLVLIEIGDLEVPPYSVWTPADPNKPNGIGFLDAWVAPPTPFRASIRVAGLGGGDTADDSLRVGRSDIFEPNDSIPRQLGPLPFGFFNPALAFEQRIREELGADWYQFEQPTTGHRTFAVFSEQIGTQAFRAYVTQPGVFSRNATGDIVVTGSGWGLGGPGVQICGGVPLTFDVLAGPGMVAAFGDLPAGSYEILVPYGQIALTGYVMLIINDYESDIPPDRDEENDICSLAKPLTVGEAKLLTIDNPYDTDWFRYSPAVDELAVFTTALIGEDSTGFQLPELDIFVFHDAAGTVTPIAESTASDNRTDVAAVTLQAGEQYLILVTDFVGESARYSLTLTTTPAVGAAAEVRAPLERIRVGLDMPTNDMTAPSRPMRLPSTLRGIRRP